MVYILTRTNARFGFATLDWQNGRYHHPGVVMRDRPQSPEPLADRRSAAAYVATLSSDLAAIARRHGLHTLGFILEMASQEAEHASQGSGNSGR